jgi:hypothetical protein
MEDFRFPEYFSSLRGYLDRAVESLKFVFYDFETDQPDYADFDIVVQSVKSQYSDLVYLNNMIDPDLEFQNMTPKLDETELSNFFRFRRLIFNTLEQFTKDCRKPVDGKIQFDRSRVIKNLQTVALLLINELVNYHETCKYALSDELLDYTGLSTLLFSSDLEILYDPHVV